MTVGPDRLPLAGAEPLQPLAVRLEAAAQTYPFLAALLLEAARQIRTESDTPGKAPNGAGE